MKRFALALVALAACTHDYGNAVVLREASPRDAGTVIVFAEGGAEPIAPVDAGGDASTGFCAALNPKPTLCTDFDTGDFLTGSGWMKTEANGGTVVRDGVTPSSPPFDALLTSPIGTTAAARAASLVATDFPLPMQALTFSFDIRVDSFAAAGDSPLDVVVLKLPTADTPDRVIQVQLAPNGQFTLLKRGNGVATMAPQKLQLDNTGYTRMSLEIDVGLKSIGLTFDGKAGGDPVSFTLATPTSRELRIGDAVLQATIRSWVVRVDNLVLDVH